MLDGMYGGRGRKRLPAVADRLEKLLNAEASDHQAILGEACWSLLCELRGDLTSAISYRRNEVRLIRKLWRSAEQSPEATRRVIMKHYDYSDLADRLDLLAILYHDSGQLKKALRTLWQCREFCEIIGIKFDGKDLLREYLAEAREKPAVR